MYWVVRTFSASRRGIRLTPSRWAHSDWRTCSPGSSSPRMIALCNSRVVRSAQLVREASCDDLSASLIGPHLALLTAIHDHATCSCLSWPRGLTCALRPAVALHLSSGPI